MSKKAVLLLSSGLDSSANLELQKAQSVYSITHALTVDYGQRASKQELIHAAMFAKHYEIEHKVVQIDLAGLLDLSSTNSKQKECDQGGDHTRRIQSPAGALLNSTSELPLLDASALDDVTQCSASAKKVWVPNRNGILINLAAAVAEANGLDAVVVGFNAEEARTFPDNSVDFLDAANQALSFSTANQVKVISFTAEYSKTQIVEKLAATKYPLQHIWSCYEGGEKHCKKCESCLRLFRALSQAAVEGVI